MRNSMKVAVITLGVSIVIASMALVALRPQSTKVLIPSDAPAAEHLSPADDSNADQAANGGTSTGQVSVRRQVSTGGSSNGKPSTGNEQAGAHTPADSVSTGADDAAEPTGPNPGYAGGDADGVMDGGPDTVEPDDTSGNTGNTGDTGGNTGNTGNTGGDTGGSTGSTGGITRRPPPGELHPITNEQLQNCIAQGCFGTR